jgi:hypothetical protein
MGRDGFVRRLGEGYTVNIKLKRIHKIKYGLIGNKAL